MSTVKEFKAFLDGKPEDAEVTFETTVKVRVAPATTDHVVTKEDLVENPELAAEGVEAGETIQIPVAEDGSEAAA